MNTKIVGADRFNIRGIPSGSDAWCKANCQSFDQCNFVFGNDFVDLQMKTDFNALDGPGNHLITGVSLGDTIASESFATQFILDLARALSLSPCQFYVTSVVAGDVYHTWSIENVIVTFRFFPAEGTVIKELTRQMQFPDSELYKGNVTSATDDLFGLVAVNWDATLKLSYSMSIIGEGDVKTDTDGTVYLDQGSERFCKDASNEGTAICEFETFFIQDVSEALGVTREEIEILFIKSFGLDSVLVSFRFIPPYTASGDTGAIDATWLSNRMTDLKAQVKDLNSALYSGNVTIRTDQTWGVSASDRQTKSLSPYLRYAFQATSLSSYERCKATHRCSRGWENYDQTTATVEYTEQSFGGGIHSPSIFFSGFEDWRKGTYSLRSSEPANSFSPSTITAPRNAHLDPFSYTSLGPSIPSYNSSKNNGLVLNSASLTSQLIQQQKWIDKIQATIDFAETNKDTAIMDAKKRARVNVRQIMQKTKEEYEAYHTFETNKKTTLANSQCTNVPCELMFNTSSGILSGAINVVGEIVQLADASNTEVAVFAFDSIDIGSNVAVTLTGQRALILLSRSSAKIDTTFQVHSGVLSGFPGGYSVGRLASDKLSSVCPKWPEDGTDIFAINEIPDKRIAERCTGLVSCCPGDQPISYLTTLDNTQLKSNNVNGPGSGSIRVFKATIDTKAVSQPEIQTVTTSVRDGENLGGGFILHFNGYSTSVIPFDAMTGYVEHEIETSLNPMSLSTLSKIERSDSSDPDYKTAGIGKVSVSRVKNSPLQFGTHVWSITFESFVGNVGEVDSTPLTVTNLLTGIHADVQISTVQHGNSIGGNFKLSFLGSTTNPMSHDVTASEMETELKRAISDLEHVFVHRTDPTNNCNDGYCKNGPTKEGGYTWTLTLFTYTDNVTPTFPLSPLADNEGAYSTVTATNQLVDTICTDYTVDTNCPEIYIKTNHSLSYVDALRELTTNRPFSLAFGGGGAGYGGNGGAGYGFNAAGVAYGDKQISELIGGSGGQLGYVYPFEANLWDRPRGRGGAGGGAIEIVAVNDIILGPNSHLYCDGENGFDSEMTAGGGGSGGSLLLNAGGTIKLDGKLSVKGGNGGSAEQPNGRSDLATNGHGGAGSGGRIALYGQSVTFGKNSVIDASGGVGAAGCDVAGVRDCKGSHGTLYYEEDMGHDMYIDETKGAESTSSSLFLKQTEVYESATSTTKVTPFRQKGPEFTFPNSVKPGRTTFYVQISGETQHPDTVSEVKKDGWGTTFELKELDWEDSATRMTSDQSVLIGVHIGKTIRHGANYYGEPGDTTYDESLKTLYNDVKLDVWYKVDIRIDWDNMVYDIYLDDVLRVDKASFSGAGVKRLGLNTHRHVATWYDEIYVGTDATMNFRCPKTLDNGIEMTRPTQTGWKADDIGGYSTRHKMRRHTSHLSRRDIYQYNNAGLTPFDGDGHNKFTSDVKYRFATGDRENLAGGLNAGTLLKVPKGAKSGREDSDRYYWFGEHTNTDGSRDGYDYGADMQGGVGACSTDDFITWRNEGIMFHFTNITDMVFGTNGPFVIERPKVLYSNATKKYVMWMGLDDATKTLGLAGVAVSDFPNGPFDFVRSFYPDGNETHDQTVFQDENGTAFLARTYYSTVDYILPSPVMQPLWESVKNKDGSTNYGLSYHRAEYEPAYDDFHDIYLQRWRTEDRPWEVICVNKLTKVERVVPFGETNFDGEVCQDPTEYKIVKGQGQYGSDLKGVVTRFLDPSDKNNSWWQPSSVPTVKAQPWSKNYMDGSCGIRKLDNDMHVLDPDLKEREIGGRSTCSNVVDNAVHPTPPDKLIGSDIIVEQRRAKFVAISKLTDDYLDTSGVIKSFEGEMENASDLITLVSGMSGFGWDSGDEIGSAYQQQVFTEFDTVHDWETRFHQYETNYNDRAMYSLACMLDGSCPVNFKDQVSF